MTAHVTEQLNDYVDGLLSSDEQRAVESHLSACSECREELDSVKRLLRRSSQLPKTIRPERDLWQGIERRIREVPGEAPVLPMEFGRQKKLLPQSGSARWLRPVLAAAAFIAVATIGNWWYGQLSSPSWNIAVVEGAVRIGSDFLSGDGRIRVGDLLETGETARARIQVGTIGHVEVEPRTRIRLLQASPNDHRLGLDEGTIHATIIAPPRLFFVQTPSALAVDLGCAYTLEVDPVGSSTLHVTSGWVALEFNGRESIVPAGAACRTRPGFGPGTPYQEDASEKMVHVLQQYDFEGGSSHVLSIVLAEARNIDSITLWHLFLRTEGKDRENVYDRLASLVPPPSGVTREGVIDDNREMIARWQKYLNLEHMQSWGGKKLNN